MAHTFSKPKLFIDAIIFFEKMFESKGVICEHNTKRSRFELY